ILESMSSVWQFIWRDGYEATFWGILGALRIRELVDSGKEDQSKAALQVADLWLNGERAMICIRKSKMYKWDKGTQLVLV
ncbi:hypothetical protein JRQ81_018204, partial [Phrynocephalus forsythii]